MAIMLQIVDLACLGIVPSDLYYNRIFRDYSKSRDPRYPESCTDALDSA